jgi:hypothetical protein
MLNLETYIKQDGSFKKENIFELVMGLVLINTMLNNITSSIILFIMLFNYIDDVKKFIDNVKKISKVDVNKKHKIEFKYMCANLVQQISNILIKLKIKKE